MESKIESVCSSLMFMRCVAHVITQAYHSKRCQDINAGPIAFWNLNL